MLNKINFEPYALYLIKFSLWFAGAALNIKEATSLPYIPQDRPESVLTAIRSRRPSFAIIMKEQAEGFPYHATGQVKAIFGQYVVYGTGILINRQYVLTAAHNLYHPDLQCFAGGVKFFPGKCSNKDKAPWKCSGKYWKIHPKYLFNKSKTHDIGIFKLKEPVRKALGWYGLRVYDPTKLSGKKITIRGYPDGDPDNDQDEYKDYYHRLCESRGRIEPISHARRMSYKVDTLVGHSGSGIEIQVRKKRKGTDYYCVGVHAYGGEKENWGVRICKYRFKDIKRWIREIDEYEQQSNASVLSVSGLEDHDEAITEDLEAANKKRKTSVKKIDDKLKKKKFI